MKNIPTTDSRITKLQTINPVAITQFGAWVYGTNTSISDDDLIVIIPDGFQGSIGELERDIADIQCYRKSEFQQMLDRHEICAMECFFHNQTIHHEFEFALDFGKLRAEISKVSNNSWVKGYKKLTVTSDYNKRLAVKSIFHSIRILDFGIQLATHGRIVEFASMNWLFQDLMKVSEGLEGEALWLLIKSKYEKLFKAKGKAFRKLAPKTPKEKNLMDYLLAMQKETATQQDEYSQGKREIVLEILKNYI